MAESRIDELRRRLEREPASRLFAQLAEELRKAGDTSEAIRICRAGLAHHPAYPSARLTLGRALLDGGDRKAARAELAEAVRQAPDNIVARRLLGKVLDDLGDLPAALEQYAGALRMMPDEVALREQIRDLALRIAPALGPLPVSPIEAAAAGESGGSEVGAAPARGHKADPVPPSAASVVSTATTAAKPGTAGGSGYEASVEPGAPVSATGLAAQGAEVERLAAVSSELWEELGPEPTARTGPAHATELAAPAAGEAAKDDDSGAGSTPFSSSTLAELYFRQGLHERALEVYRQVLEADPANARVRARMLEIGAAAAGSASAGDAGTDGRRQALERTIAELESLLSALRRH